MCIAATCIAVAAGSFWLTRNNAATEPVVLPVSWNAQPEMDPQAILNMMKEQAAPAAQHKILEMLAGNFDAEMSFLMAPDAEPDVSKGSTKNSLVLGGRFLLMDFKGNINMMGEQMDLTGLGMMGFDKAKNNYVMTWADTLSTSLIIQTGAPGSDEKRIETSGMVASVMGDAMAKHVYIIESKDKHTLEFWQAVPGMDEMMKIGWITYTRKAG